ncbi:hypothetical protein PGTUg99_023973 [Puccinia graminis f. sp. tritici]|uniref:Alpha-galactosidase n=1 Tax=Puccinia graminis f. sp. tritici TaxID=56615 RepID=A0A5B0R5B5_PUCGR|nr:hypothetical protein PGTUg99_023973 [Puccinia graminis f. sp. tritici]
MNNWINNPQRFRVGVEILLFTLLTIGLTTENPIELVARNEATPTGPKPAMGWSSDWALGCEIITDDEMYWEGEQMARRGLVEAGYTTLIFECAWEIGYEDDWSPKASVVSSQNVMEPRILELTVQRINVGVGTWGGKQLCLRDPQPSSELGMEAPRDLNRYIQSIAEAGVVYLIHRPCDMATPEFLQNPEKAHELDSRYVAMQEAIQNTRSSLFYATGQWGSSPLAQQKKANSWRVSDEQLPTWDSFIRTLNGVVPYAHQARPGAYNDLGFLRLARFRKMQLTMTEKRTISPLIFSDDMERMDQDTIEMLKNRRVIAVNQDDLGKSITLRRRYPNHIDIWTGPMKDGSTVAIIVNWSGEDIKDIPLDDMGFSSARLQDVWSGIDIGHKEKVYQSVIPTHGSLFLKLTETKPSPPKAWTRFTIDTAEVVAPAKVAMLGTVKVATLIAPEGQGSVVWNDVPGGGTTDVVISLDYINAGASESYKDHGNLNFRRAVIVVNDDPNLHFPIHFPVTGVTWADIYPGFLASIKLPNKTNRVRIQGLDQWAPDFVSLSVEKPAAQAA